MDIRCPQCDQIFAADPAADDRYTCTSCSVSLFVKREPDFQAIAALAFPAQNTPSAPLKSFFTIAPSQVPGEWTGEASAAAPAALSRSSLGASEDAPNADAGGSTLDQPPPPFPQPDTAMLDDDVEMTSMAGGSFASALTAAPLTPPAVGSSAMAPPPWENDQPGVTPPAQESWAVGPPALPPRAPPPLTKKQPKSADDFARALGLPEIAIQEPERPMAAPRSISSAPSDAAKDEDDDSALAKPKSRALWVVAVIAVVLVGGGVFAALKTPPPLPSAPAQPTGPSIEEEPASTSSASGPSGSRDSKTAQDAAEKRAKVIDHYNMGNKHYLQRKYPQALEEFRLALELDPTFALAHRGMGVTYAKQGKAELAIKEYKAYLKLAPDAKDASQVQKVIKEFEQ